MSTKAYLQPKKKTENSRQSRPVIKQQLQHLHSFEDMDDDEQAIAELQLEASLDDAFSNNEDEY